MKTAPMWSVGRSMARISGYGQEGTEFFNRMASCRWFREAMIEVCQRHFPMDEYSIYGHGRSTGGPFINMLSQRVPTSQE